MFFPKKMLTNSKSGYLPATFSLMIGWIGHEDHEPECTSF